MKILNPPTRVTVTIDEGKMSRYNGVKISPQMNNRVDGSGDGGVFFFDGKK